MPKSLKSMEELNRMSGPELQAHIQDELDSLGPEAFHERLKEIFAAERERGQTLFSQVGQLLDSVDTGFEAVVDASLEPGQRLQLLRRLSALVKDLVMGLREEPDSCPPACPYDAFVDELEDLLDHVRGRRLHDRIELIGIRRGWDPGADDLLYERACREIDPREIGMAYGWEPPQEVLETLVEASAAALTKAG